MHIYITIASDQLPNQAYTKAQDWYFIARIVFLAVNIPFI